jgi:hypothetical protein
VSTDFAAGLFHRQLVAADWPQPQVRLETIQLEQQHHLGVPRPRLLFKLMVLGRWSVDLEHSPLSRWELQCFYEKLSVGVLGPVWLQSAHSGMRVRCGSASNSHQQTFQLPCQQGPTRSNYQVGMRTEEFAGVRLCRRRQGPIARFSEFGGAAIVTYNDYNYTPTF